MLSHSAVSTGGYKLEEEEEELSNCVSASNCTKSPQYFSKAGLSGFFQSEVLFPTLSQQA